MKFLTFQKPRFVIPITKTTSPQQIKKTIRKILAQQQELLDFLKDPIIITDHKYRIQLWNKAVRKILRPKINKYKLRNTFCWQVSYCSGKSLNKCLAVKTKKLKKRATTEIQVGKRSYQLTIDPILDNRKKFIGSVHIFRDITESKTLAQELQQSEAQYESLVKNIKAGIFRITADGSFIENNPALFKILGFRSTKQLIKHKFSSFFADPQDYKRLLRKLKKNSLVTAHELSLKRKNGKALTVLINAHAYLNKRRNIEWIDGILEDITQRKKIEQKLILSEQRFRKTVECSHDLIMISRPDATIEYLSTAATKIIGFRPQDLIGKVYKIYHPEDNQLFNKAYHQTIRRKTSNVIEYRILTKRKKLKWIHHSLAPILENGKTIRVISIISDVTEQKLALQQQQEEIAKTLHYQSALLKLAQVPFTDLTTTIKQILEIDAQTLNVERVGFWLLSDDQSEIHCQDLYIKSKNSHEQGAILYAQKYPYYFHALRQDRLIAVSDVYNSIETFEFSKDYLKPHRISSMMDVPIRIAGKLVGILCHEHIGPQRKWTYEEQNFAASVADRIAVVLQTHQRQLIQNVLKESEQKYRTLVENINIGVYRTTPDGRIIEANPALARIFGYSSPDEIKKIKVSGLYYDPALRPKVLNLLQKQGFIKNYEVASKRKDGTKIICSLTAQAHYSLEGKIDWYDGVVEDITERKQYEQTLKESELKYRTLVELSKVGIAIVAPDTKILFVNPAAIKILGAKSAQEIIGQSALKFVHPDYHMQVKNNITQMVKYSKVPPIQEQKFIRIDGSIVDVEVSAKIFPYQNQLALMILADDITERKKQQSLLIASEEKYRSLVNNVNIGVYRSTPDGKFLEVNPMMAKIFGYKSPDELKKVPIEKLYKYPQERNKLVQKMVSNGLVRNFESVQLTKDGKEIYVSITARAHRNQEGKIDWYDGVIEDITFRKQTEQALRESELRYRTLFDCSNDGIVVLSPTGVVIDANKKILEMGGFTKDQIGQHISSYSVFTKQDLNIILQKMQARLAGKEVKPYEVKIHRPDGKELTVEITAEILKDSNGKPFADVAFIHDITERKQFETALIQAKESAEAANKAKTAFLHNMSHELRSPLTSIVGFTNLLLEKETDKEKKEMLEIIKNSSNYLLKIINDLLQLSRIEAGKITIDKKEFNLYDLANTIYKRYSIQAQNKGLNFKLTIPPNLPALIIADSTKIEQIINNLIDNAIKFTLQGEIELNINIKKESKTKQPILEFYIKDTGIGIQKERIDQIFDRFVQGEFYISKKYGGAGLGLPIIKELLTIMNGSISVQSKVGKGTKFTIQIPIKISK